MNYRYRYHNIILNNNFFMINSFPKIRRIDFAVGELIFVLVARGGEYAVILKLYTDVRGR